MISTRRLERENADPYHERPHQPRVWRSSDSGSFDVTVSEGTLSLPGPVPIPEPVGDRRCWRTFGGDPQRSLAPKFPHVARIY
jgi:hypothetical protein